MQLNNEAEYKLIVVTRKGELEKEEELKEKYKWLQILHKSGSSELPPLYSMSDVAFLPQLKSKYLDMAIGVKMMEYISFGLPVIVNNLYEMKKFVEDNNIGYSYDESIESLADTVMRFYSDDSSIKELRKNVDKTRRENSWTKRVDKIVRDFEVELSTYYNEADLCSLMIEPNVYIARAIPFKTYEYLAHEIPIISSQGTTIGKFVGENEIGWNIEYKSSAIERTLREIIHNPHLLDIKREKCKTVKVQNLWTVRAQTVANDLICIAKK